MGSVKRTAKWILILLLTACGSHMDYEIGKPVFDPTQKPIELGIQVPDTEGSILDLDKDPEIPTVVVIAEEFCVTCIEETKEFQSAIKNINGIPNKINLYTILAGSDQSEAKAWKAKHSVQWPVAYDARAAIFHQFCPENVVPCVFVHIPQKGIVFLTQKKTTVEELKYWTGPWEEE